MKNSYWNLDKIGRVKLSKNFQMRQFLYSEIATSACIPNIPDDPDLAIEAGKKLCENILEPLVEAFGPIIVRSGYRSCAVNDFGWRNRLACSSNEDNYAYHIWDRIDRYGCMGAAACLIVPIFNAGLSQFKTWQDFAWWMDDRLDHNGITFFKQDYAFNIGWSEDGDPTIHSTRDDGPKTIKGYRRSKAERDTAALNPHPPRQQDQLV